MVSLYRSNRDMKTYAFEVTELIAEVRCDLPGHFKAAVASEVMEMALICKRHMNTKVIEVNELKSGVSRGLLVSEVVSDRNLFRQNIRPNILAKYSAKTE